MSCLERMAGITSTNSAVVGKLGAATAIFPTFSMISHSCLANCRFCKETSSDAFCVICIDNTRYASSLSPVNGAHVEIRAKRAISEGEELTIEYKSLLTGNAERTRRIKKIWLFDCDCSR